jgi:ABC-type antimicrobial peptide transport system permease subunit
MSQIGSSRIAAMRSLPPLAESTRPALVASIRQSARSAGQSLGAYRLRAALTLVGIVVGVAGLLLILDLGDVTQDYVALQWSHVGANSVSVGYRPAPGVGKAAAMAMSTLSLADVQALQRLPHVTAASPIGFDGIPIVAGAITSGGWPIEAGFPSIETLQNLSLQSGSFFTEQDEASGATVVVIGPEVADHFFPGADPVGRELRLGNVNFRVVGVVSSQSNDNQPDVTYLPFSTYQQRLSGHNAPQLMLQVDQTDNIPSVIAAVSQTLDRQHHLAFDQQSDFVVWYNNASADPQVQQLNLAHLVTSVVAAIALLIGGFGVAGTMFLSVRQRTSEIGLRLAVGAQPDDVLRQFLTEAVTLSVAGGIVGILVGTIATVGFYLDFRDALLGHWFRQAVQNHPVPSPVALVAALVTCLIVGVGFGFLPARRAASLDPIVALRES